MPSVFLAALGKGHTLPNPASKPSVFCMILGVETVFELPIIYTWHTEKYSATTVFSCSDSSHSTQVACHVDGFFPAGFSIRSGSVWFAPSQTGSSPALRSSVLNIGLQTASTVWYVHDLPTYNLHSEILIQRELMLLLLYK